MKKLFNIPVFIALFLIACLAACNPKPLDIELPQHQEKLVVSSQVIPNQGLVISVSKSFSTLAAPSEDLENDSLFLKKIAVDHAYVAITYLGQTEVLKRIGFGLYVSTQMPHFFHESYSLLVRDSVSGLECSATSMMLPQTKFETIQPVVEKNAKDTAVFLAYSFFDQEEIKNHYLLSVITTRRKKTNSIRDRLGMSDLNSHIFLLKDTDFNGKLLTQKQRLQVLPSDSIVVSLTNISQEYYNYLALYQKSGNIYNQFTGEPITMHGNIHNGFGFFNLTHPYLTTFNLSAF